MAIGTSFPGILLPQTNDPVEIGKMGLDLLKKINAIVPQQPFSTRTSLDMTSTQYPIVFVTTGPNTINVYLPYAAKSTIPEIRVFKVDSGTGSVNIYAKSGDSIAAFQSVNLSSQFAMMDLITDSNKTWVTNVVTEYAFNTSTTATGNDTTSFGNGSQGNLFGAITAQLVRRVRFLRPMLNDIILVEASNDGGTNWVSMANGITDGSAYFISSLIEQSSITYGFGFIHKINATDIDIVFGTYAGNASAAFGAAGYAWSIPNSAGVKWRVRKTSIGN